MEIVDVCAPVIDKSELQLNSSIEKELNDFITIYSKRDEIMAAGIETPKSLLLYGPPGCGKTTIATYVAMQTGLPLVTARLDGMISSLLGSTAKYANDYHNLKSMHMKYHVLKLSVNLNQKLFVHLISKTVKLWW